MASLPQNINDKIQQESSESYHQNFVEVELGDGYSQRASIGLRPFYSIWEIVVWPLTLTELKDFKNFWKDHGYVVPFSWQSFEDDNSKEWVFASEPEIENVAKVYRVSFTLKEVC